MLKKILLILLVFSLVISCKNSKLSATHSFKNQGAVPTPVLNLDKDLDKNPGKCSNDLEERKAHIRSLLSEEQFKTITKGSQGNAACVESNAAQLKLPSGPNSSWYYTYENFVTAMATMPAFACEGTYRTRILEIAAFFANVNQETGAQPDKNAFTAGCFIQEGGGVWWKNTANPYGGFEGRGPLQLSYNYNYKAYSNFLVKQGIVTTGSNKDPSTNADILTTDPSIGILGSLWFWMNGSQDTPPTGNIPFKPDPHDVIVGNWAPTATDVSANRTADRAMGVIMNVINGIECKGGTASAISKGVQREKSFTFVAKVLGVEIKGIDHAKLGCGDMDNFADTPSRNNPTYPNGNPIPQGSNSPDAQKRAPYQKAVSYNGPAPSGDFH